MAGGTDKRQRGKQCLVRLTEDEYARLATRAEKAGMATAAFLRAAALGDAGPRAQRRAPADKDALLRILGHLGRIGNNVNQIARRLNTGEAVQLPRLEEALAAYLEIRNAIYEALGLTPKGNPAGPNSRFMHGHQGPKPRRS
jgi:hypothetical protein